MRITDKLCKSMDKVNEDVICYGKDFAFVIDGQSSINDKNAKTTKWYVNVLKRELKKNIIHGTLLNSLNQTIKSASSIFKKTFSSMEVPSATIAIIRQKKLKIEILIVGNAKCLLQTKKIELVEDPRMDKVENNILKKAKLLCGDKNINSLELKNKFHELLSETRNKVNTMGGYPAIKDKPLNEEDVVYKEYDYNDVISAIICTDGFYAYKTYLMIKDKDLYAIINNQGLAHCYKHIRRMESKDVNCSSFPRLQLYDDVSALYIVFY